MHMRQSPGVKTDLFTRPGWWNTQVEPSEKSINPSKISNHIPRFSTAITRALKETVSNDEPPAGANPLVSGSRCSRHDLRADAVD